MLTRFARWFWLASAPLLVVSCTDPAPTVDASVDAPDSDAGDAGDVATDPETTYLAAVDAMAAASEGGAQILLHRGYPRTVIGSWPVDGTDRVVAARAFLDRWGAVFRQGSPELAHPVTRLIEADDTVVRFRQTYRGLPVFGAGVVIAFHDTHIISAIGTLMTEDQTLEIAPSIGPRDAEIAAREWIGGTLAIHGRSELVVMDRALLDETSEHELHLAYRVTVGAQEVLVDAATGEALFASSFEQPAFRLDLETANYSSSDNTACFWFTTNDDRVGDETGVYPAYTPDLGILGTYQSLQRAHAFYLTSFGRDSYDGSGAEILAYVHTTTPNATLWSGTCDAVNYADALMAYDITVHELTHAVINDTSELIYGYESGALNESYADVMAVLADHNFTLGESSVAGTLRNLSDPTSTMLAPNLRQPERYSQLVGATGPATPLNDYGAVHSNSGIMNKAAYLVMDGGVYRGVTYLALGWDLAGALFYQSMITHAPATTMRMASDQIWAYAHAWAATSYRGMTAAQACSVANAYAGVEVGPGDLACDGILDDADNDDDGDRVPDAFDNCPRARNPFQQDTDHDTIGDVCDPDLDGDGVPNTRDNCPTRLNADQADANHDQIGDVCQDEDGDGVLDPTDDCPHVSNADQADVDHDGRGDACDPDFDGDGLAGGDTDNCPWTANADQADTDHDGLGDACDRCPATADPLVAWSTGNRLMGIPPAPIQPDEDGDGVPDLCDPTPYGLTDSVQVDGTGLHPSSAPLVPGSGMHTILLTAGPTADVAFALPACAPPCPEYFAPGTRRTLELARLPDTVAAYVSDEIGRVVAQSGHADVTGASRIVDFAPVAGHAYELHFVTRSDVDPASGPFSFAVAFQ